MKNKKVVMICGTPTGFHNPLINKVYFDDHVKSKESDISKWNNPDDSVSSIIQELSFNLMPPREKNFLPNSFYKFSFEK